MRDERIMGGALVIAGLLALAEAWRLHQLRTSLVAGAVVGDDTLPMIVGLSSILLGGYTLARATFPPTQISFPHGVVRRRMLWGAGSLLSYAIVLPYLGYTAGTALGSTLLFRGLGGYTWVISLLLGGLTTVTLYLLFRVWLLQPLPVGLLGL